MSEIVTMWLGYSETILVLTTTTKLMEEKMGFIGIEGVVQNMRG